MCKFKCLGEHLLSAPGYHGGQMKALGWRNWSNRVTGGYEPPSEVAGN